MADVRTERSGPLALLIGFGCFVVFETVVFFLLRWLVSGLGESNQYQPENTITANWVKTSVFLLLHLILLVVAVLTISNALPRRFRGQIMGWFYLALVTMFLLLWPLFE
ncbi:hypothetical protein [Hymenobacter koreensis]|uniref:Uncharacterized protein n=1 Tax=Hymenobacter koreensis TaxID=1084523 RepID=A0ABP8JH45_9BACT